jgi:hypothetical protein
MSKLIKCRSCQAEIASDSKACPKCGSPNKKRGRLGIVFGVVLAVASVLFLIAAGSAEKGELNAESKTEKDESSASVPKKDNAGTSSQKKDTSTVSGPKGNEREKLKVKGLYIGMRADQVIAAITPAIKEICQTADPDLKLSERLFNSEGEFLPTVIQRKEGDNGGEVVVINPTNVKFGYRFFSFSSTKEGLVDQIGFEPIFFKAEQISYEDFVQQVIDGYKLVLIGPKAILASGGANGRTDGLHANLWICDLPIGVRVSIGKQTKYLMLRKIESEAEHARKLEDAKKGFN